MVDASGGADDTVNEGLMRPLQGDLFRVLVELKEVDPKKIDINALARNVASICRSSVHMRRAAEEMRNGIGRRVARGRAQGGRGGAPRRARRIVGERGEADPCGAARDRRDAGAGCGDDRAFAVAQPLALGDAAGARGHAAQPRPGSGQGGGNSERRRDRERRDDAGTINDWSRSRRYLPRASPTRSRPHGLREKASNGRGQTGSGDARVGEKISSRGLVKKREVTR